MDTELHPSFKVLVILPFLLWYERVVAVLCVWQLVWLVNYFLLSLTTEQSKGEHLLVWQRYALLTSSSVIIPRSALFLCLMNDRPRCCSIFTTWLKSASPCHRWVTTACSSATIATHYQSTCPGASSSPCPPMTLFSSTSPRSVCANLHTLSPLPEM